MSQAERIRQEKLQEQFATIEEQIIETPDIPTSAPPTPPPETPSPEPTPTPEPTPQPMRPQAKPYYDENPDYVGHVHILDSEDGPYPEINYPIVQTDHWDTESPYLHMDFYEKDSPAGTIFASSWSENPTVLLGHNMGKKSGYVQFGGLRRYSQQPGFLEDHKIIHLNTLYEEKVFKVIAVYYFTEKYVKNELIGDILVTGYVIPDLNGDETRSYLDVYGTGDPVGFLKFLETYPNVFYLDPDIDATPDSQFLSLQCCIYQGLNGRSITHSRLVVMAIEIDQEQNKAAG